MFGRKKREQEREAARQGREREREHFWREGPPDDDERLVGGLTEKEQDRAAKEIGPHADIMSIAADIKGDRTEEENRERWSRIPPDTRIRRNAEDHEVLRLYDEKYPAERAEFDERHPQPQPDRGRARGGAYGPDPREAEAKEMRERGEPTPRSRQQAERRGRGRDTDRDNEPDHDRDL